MQFHCITLTEQYVILVYTGHIHQLQYGIVEFHVLVLKPTVAGSQYLSVGIC